jgi:hypothetical protein
MQFHGMVELLVAKIRKSDSGMLSCFVVPEVLWNSLLYIVTGRANQFEMYLFSLTDLKIYKQ